MKKLVFANVCLLLISGKSLAQETAAGFFVEPMVTYERGEGDINFPAPFANSESKVRGYGVGVRLGTQVYDIVFAGLDARYSLPTFQDSSLNQDVSATSWNVSPVVGVQMPSPVGLRLWGSWIVAGELDPDRDKGVDEKFIGGNGYRLGAGFRVGLVSLNAEYQYIDYDETEIAEVGIFSPGYSSKNIALENKSLIFSVSMPIGL